ncbi:MAG TPA: ABC transporter substrate-binding protein [Candidatus Binatia bacterium]
MNTNLRSGGFAGIVFLLITGIISVANAAQRIARIGLLVPENGPAELQTLKGLKDRLKELGYVEGDNLVLELKEMRGDRSGLKADANDLVQKKVNVIFTMGTRATNVARTATKDIPIVFRHPADPVAVGFVKNLKHPESNVTGVAAFSTDMNSKRIEILKTVVPNLRRIHVFYDSNNRYSPDNFLAVERAAPKLQVEVVDHPVKTVTELAKSLDKLQVRDGDAILQVSDDLFESQADNVFDAAKKLKLPTMFDDESWAAKGSLLTYGANYTQMGRQAAEIIVKLLNRAKPKEVPVVAANKFDLVVNLRTANAIGVSVPADVLKRADKVIR